MKKKKKRFVLATQMFPQGLYEEKFTRELKRRVACLCLKSKLSRYKKYKLLLEEI